MGEFNMSFDLGGIIGGLIGAAGAYFGVVWTIKATADQQRDDAKQQIAFLRKAIIIEVIQIGVELQNFNLASSTASINRQFFHRSVSEVTVPLVVPSLIPKLGLFSPAEADRLLMFYNGVTRLLKCLERARNADTDQAFEIITVDLSMELQFACGQVRHLLELMAPDENVPGKTTLMVDAMRDIEAAHNGR